MSSEYVRADEVGTLTRWGKAISEKCERIKPSPSTLNKMALMILIIGATMAVTTGLNHNGGGDTDKLNLHLALEIVLGVAFAGIFAFSAKKRKEAIDEKSGVELTEKRKTTWREDLSNFGTAIKEGARATPYHLFILSVMFGVTMACTSGLWDKFAGGDVSDTMNAGIGIAIAGFVVFGALSFYMRKKKEHTEERTSSSSEPSSRAERRPSGKPPGATFPGQEDEEARLEAEQGEE